MYILVLIEPQAALPALVCESHALDDSVSGLSQ